MLFKPALIEPILEQTVRVVRAAFRKGNSHLTLCDELATL